MRNGLSIVANKQEEEQQWIDTELKLLEEILEAQNISSVFQPIVSLKDATILGYEALSRGPLESALEAPNALFSAAERHNKIWELEFLCRAKALEKAKSLAPDKMLFINVDPRVIHDDRFHKGLTREMLSRYEIDASHIIFEITERTAIKDYRNFRRILDNYVSQGYQIAIDDTGSGYSGLKMLAETRPQYIKIDMDLIRDIDQDSLKQELLRAFYDFSLITNMKMIAEGIETLEELSTLIDIGIQYGQGYFLHRPEAHFADITLATREFILAKNQQKREETFHTMLTMPIGEIARQDEGIPEDTHGQELLDFFRTHPTRMGVTVVRNGRAVGLVMKNKFLSHLATQYGIAVYMNRPISLLMDRHPLIVDYDTPLEQVSKFAVSRGEDSLYDYIVITRHDVYYGITTVKRLLEKTTQLEISRAKHANPLSGLPGNVLIEEKLKACVEQRQDFAVLYFDLDNFKAYNDTYGFENGDKIICLLAGIIQQQVNRQGGGEAFVGHIGGDDFIAVLPSSHAERVCLACIAEFDASVKEYYNKIDQAAGHIMAKNRHGEWERFPIISLSIAVATNRRHRFRNLAEIGEVAGQLKKQCKLDWRSCYVLA